jgi:hypothetical protein
MLYSEKYKFCFVHIYKNAGTSIRKALEPFCYTTPIQRKSIKFIKMVGFNPPRFDPNYLSNHASSVEIRHHLGEYIYDNLLSFSVVRNPWDWQFSLYNYAKKHDFVQFRYFQTFSDYLHSDSVFAHRSQTSFVYDPERSQINVNKIFKFENIRQDLLSLSAYLRLPTPISLPVLNKVNLKSPLTYRDAYSQTLKHLIAERFALDISNFDYSF